MIFPQQLEILNKIIDVQLQLVCKFPFCCFVRMKAQIEQNSQEDYDFHLNKFLKVGNDGFIITYRFPNVLWNVYRVPFLFVTKIYINSILKTKFHLFNLVFFLSIKLDFMSFFNGPSHSQSSTFSVSFLGMVHNFALNGEIQGVFFVFFHFTFITTIIRS